MTVAREVSAKPFVMEDYAMSLDSAAITPQRPRTTQAKAPSRTSARRPRRLSYRARVHASFLEMFPAVAERVAYERTKRWYQQHGAWTHRFD